ncbi:MAG: EamA family transporter [Pirellulaceae bacterium]
MTALSLALLLIRVASSVWASVLQKQLFAHWYRPTEIVYRGLGWMTIALAPVAIGSFLMHPGDSDSWAVLALPLAVACLLDGVGNVLLVASIGRGELSVIGPINSYKPLVGLLGAWWWLGERPTSLSLWGMLVILSGTWCLAQGRSTDRGATPLHAIAARFASIVLTALASVFLKEALLRASWLEVLWGWALGSSVVAMSIDMLMRRTGLSRPKEPPPTAGGSWDPKLAWISLAYAALQGSTVLLFSTIPIGPALALFQLSGILQVFLGWQLFRETHLGWRLSASLVMAVGATMVLLGESPLGVYNPDGVLEAGK